MLNLALNARNAMAGTGILKITISRADDSGSTFIHVTVIDDGVGMDDATRRRAIEPFFTTKGVGKGTGLGLSMVLGLAAQSGGRLVLYSTPGAGTRAHLWLPVAAQRLGSSDGETEFALTIFYTAGC